MDNMDNPKSSGKYYCYKCDYTTSRESQWNRHISTQKHKSVSVDNKKVPKGSSRFICGCGKEFVYNSGLSKHRKKCTIEKKEEKSEIHQENIKLEIKEEQLSTEFNNKNDIIMTLINENKKLMETIKTMAPKMGNNNNNINIQVFLNEKCKDALNISDFIQSLQISLDDINMSKNRGLVEGISYTMIKGLQDLDLYKRPFHCTDTKRDVLYVKDNEQWEKDETNNIMKNSILVVANKQRKAIDQWTKANPDWRSSEEKKEEYVNLLGTLMDPIEEDDKGERRIIKNISKEVHLNKEELNLDTDSD